MNLAEFLNSYNLDDKSTNNLPIIVACDASGSTTINYDKDRIVFKAQFDVLKSQYPDRSFRFMFWNSESKKNKNFINGIWTFDFVAKNIYQIFTAVVAQQHEFTSTKPGLAFNALARNDFDHWFKREDKHQYIEIVYLTDGAVDVGHENALSTAIKNLFQKRNNLRLYIHAIETQKRDYSSSREMSNAAGCDIARIIQKDNLQNYIANFKSHNPDCENGFSHMSNAIVPSGYIGYGTKYFPRSEELLFLNLLMHFIQENNTLDSHIRVIQNLSLTLKKLCEDCTPKMTTELHARFASLFWFDGCEIDSALASIMLKQSISSNSQITDMIYADFRTRLNDLYKQVDLHIKSPNAKLILGIRRSAISYLIGNKIFKVDSSLLDKDIIVSDIRYHQVGVLYDSKFLFPVFTSDTNHGQTTPQAIRQFTRTIVSQIIKSNNMFIDPKDDALMYIVMAMNMKVQISNVPSEIKTSYQYLAKVMLGKKRLSKDQTEYDRLLLGEFPLPNNGKIDDFYKYMSFCKQYLGITEHINPMIIWHALCQNICIDLAKMQLIHCEDKIYEVYGSMPSNLAQLLLIDLPPITYHIMEQPLDPICPVTLDNIADVGGMCIQPHQIGNTICDPKRVISTSVFDSYRKNRTGCMNCLKSDINFMRCGPFNSSNQSIDFPDDYPMPFNTTFTQMPQSTFQQPLQSTFNPSSRVQNDQVKIVIRARGTTGAGKTTTLNELKKMIVDNGGECFIEGTDKYCIKGGIDTKTAISLVTNELKKAFASTAKLVVVLIDTCGERLGGNTIFGHSFNGWKNHEIMINLPDTSPKYISLYLAWSLKNVLDRKMHDQDSTYYLNPINASVQTCIDVHTKKAQALLGSKFIRVTKSGFNKLAVLNEIKSSADEYQIYLDQNYSLEQSVKKIYTDFIQNEIKHIPNIPTPPIVSVPQVPLLTRQLTTVSNPQVISIASPRNQTIVVDSSTIISDNEWEVIQENNSIF
jgi:hypothetical protein